MTSRRKTGKAPKRAVPARAAKTRVRTASQPREAAARAPHPSKSKRATATKTTKRVHVAGNEPAVVAAGAECTIAHAANLHAQLAAVIDEASPVSLDLSAVKRVDTAGLQVLAAFVRQRRLAGLMLTCVGAAEPFLGTAKLLGLGALFSSEATA